MARPVALAVAFSLATLAAAPAFAGTLEIRDSAHVFSAAEGEALRREVASMPFDARLLTSNDYADGAALNSTVGSLVREPNMVAVGLDPTHRHVAVHFGTGSGIPRDAWVGVERAGNEAFKNGQWVTGVEDIFRRAGASAGTGSSAGSSPGASAAGFGIGALLVVVLIVGGAIWLFSRRSRPGYGYGGGVGPSYGNAPYGGAPYGGGPYLGGPQQGGGLGPVGGGLIGAGLGGVAGYELGKMEGEREGHNQGWGGGGYDQGGSSNAGVDTGGGNYDAGGGSSSWDDGGSSGGGGSDFGGGGGDFGGGGSDGGGGGGSDF